MLPLPSLAIRPISLPIQCEARPGGGPFAIAISSQWDRASIIIAFTFGVMLALAIASIQDDVALDGHFDPSITGFSFHMHIPAHAHMQHRRLLSPACMLLSAHLSRAPYLLLPTGVLNATKAGRATKHRKVQLDDRRRHSAAIRAVRKRFLIAISKVRTPEASRAAERFRFPTARERLQGVH